MAGPAKFSLLELRDLILNAKTPIVLRNFTNSWSCFDLALDQWCKKYDEEVAKTPIICQAFERMDMTDSNTPQWDRKRELIQMTAAEFLETHSKPQKFWTALNYKRAFEMPDFCAESIDFRDFGFDCKNLDASFWLSSTGANTPCHYDTYGCNIVCQIYGKKSWLLFPPNTPLTSTRLPYEETSIYCQENFYAPSLRKIDELLEKLQPYAYHVILEPKDVLIVPYQWWHYVETIDTSLSTNYWIPLKQDLSVYLDEIIVKYLIQQFIKEESPSVTNYIINPNQMQGEMSPDSLIEVYETIYKAAQEVDLSDNSTYVFTENTYYPYYFKNCDNYLKKLQSAEIVQKMNTVEFKLYLTERSNRLNGNDNELSPLNIMQELIINSVCAPYTINRVKKEFNQRLEKHL